MANVRLNSSDPVILDGTEQIPVIKKVGGVDIDGTTTAQSIANLAAAAASSPSVEVVASHTLALIDSGRFISANHASTAILITVPPNSAEAFPVDTEVHVRQRGNAEVTIAAGSGVAVNQPATRTKKLSERYAVVTLKKVATDEWALFGDLEAAP